MDFIELAKKRYSCKKYSTRPVEQEKLDRILEAGRLAPTAKNLQEQHIYIAQTDDVLSRVDRHTPCRYGAPVVLIIAYEKENVYTYPDGVLTSGMEDGAIVATHMMLAAAAEGVDSCWINRFDPDGIAAEFNIPDSEQAFMLLDLGYAAEGAGPLANHTSRKPLTDTVTLL